MFPLTVFLIALIVLYLPGCIIWLGRFGNPAATVAAAAPTSIFVYVLVGIMCSKLHIAVSAISVFAISLLFSAAIALFLLIYAKFKRTSEPFANFNRHFRSNNF